MKNIVSHALPAMMCGYASSSGRSFHFASRQGWVGQVYRWKSGTEEAETIRFIDCRNYIHKNARGRFNATKCRQPNNSAIDKVQFTARRPDSLKHSGAGICHGTINIIMHFRPLVISVWTDTSSLIISHEFQSASLIDFKDHWLFTAVQAESIFSAKFMFPHRSENNILTDDTLRISSVVGRIA